MPNAKNIGVGLLVTALIVGIVGKEAYSAGQWKKIAADFTGRGGSSPFYGQFTANRCPGEKLGRATKGAECELEFDMEMTMNGKTTHVTKDGMDVNGAHVEYESATELPEGVEMPEIKQIGPNTVQIGENMELTFLNERFVASESFGKSVASRMLGGWGNPWLPYRPPFYPPQPTPTPAPTYQCQAHEDAHDNDYIACAGGATQAAIIGGGLFFSPYTAGLSALVSFLISATINFFLASNVTGVSMLDCGKIALMSSGMGDGWWADRICNPIAFSLEWEPAPSSFNMNGGW